MNGYQIYHNYRNGKEKGFIMKLCDYECGREAKNQFKNGKWCCEDHCNKCPKMKKKSSELHKVQIPWNIDTPCTEETKNKISKKIKGINHPMYNHPRTEETKNKISRARKFTIEQIQEKYPTFSKEEEMRYNSDGEIEVHCKYNKCKNSKESDGWFIPTRRQLEARWRALENNGDGSYFYCSEECKHECCLFRLKSDPNRLSKFEKYNFDIWQETNKTLRKFSNKIKNIHLRGNKYGYSLDHKYSIYDGFENNIDPKIIGHWQNLQIITIVKNSKKGKKSSILLKELLIQIKSTKNFNRTNI